MKKTAYSLCLALSRLLSRRAPDDDTDKSIYQRGSVTFFLARAPSRSVSTSLSVVLTISRSCVLSRQCVLFSFSRSLSLFFSVPFLDLASALVSLYSSLEVSVRCIATNCNTLQHATTRYNTLQHTATISVQSCMDPAEVAIFRHLHEVNKKDLDDPFSVRSWMTC